MVDRNAQKTNLGLVVCRISSSLVVLLLSALGGCHRKDVAAPLPVAVQVATLQREPITSATRFTATVRERQRVELSFKVPGTVATLLQVPAWTASSATCTRAMWCHRIPAAAGSAGRLRLPAASWRRRASGWPRPRPRSAPRWRHVTGCPGRFRAHQGAPRAGVGVAADLRRHAWRRRTRPRPNWTRRSAKSGQPRSPCSRPKTI